MALFRRWLIAHDATRERAAASPRQRCDARTAETLRALHAVGAMDAARDAWARDTAAECCACARPEAAAESARVLISGVSARGRDQTRAAKHTRRRLVVGELERDGR